MNRLITSQNDTAPKPHDGTAYRYEVVGEPAQGYTLAENSLHFVFKGRAGNEKKALEAIEQLLGVRIEHLTPRGR